MKNRSKYQHQFQVQEESELLSFLYKHLNQGRNRTKAMLTRGQIVVDEQVETRYNRIVKVGQSVAILKHAITKQVKQEIEIIYEDEHLIVINKASGLLTIASNKEKQETAYRYLMNYVKQQHPSNRVFIVHRLDRDTSGVMVFAKTETVKVMLQDNWKEMVKKRTYIAVIEGVLKSEKQTLVSWLKESKTHKMYASSKDNGGQKAVTHLKQKATNKKYTLIELELDTGRKNQIRVQLESMKKPIIGDKKYGSSVNPIHRLALHANVLSFQHPITKKTMHFQVEAPEAFYQLVKG